MGVTITKNHLNFNMWKVKKVDNSIDSGRHRVAKGQRYNEKKVHGGRRQISIALCLKKRMD
jgi:hypothetical protein